MVFFPRRLFLRYPSFFSHYDSLSSSINSNRRYFSVSAACHGFPSIFYTVPSIVSLAVSNRYLRFWKFEPEKCIRFAVPDVSATNLMLLHNCVYEELKNVGPNCDEVLSQNSGSSNNNDKEPSALHLPRLFLLRLHQLLRSPNPFPPSSIPLFTLSPLALPLPFPLNRPLFLCFPSVSLLGRVI